MDADPALPARPGEAESNGTSTPLPPPGESGEFPRQKRRYRREDEPAAESAISDPDIAAITSLLATLIAKKQSPAPAEEAKAAKIYRFPKNAQTAGAKPALEDPQEPAGAPMPEKTNGSGAAAAAAVAPPPPPAPPALTRATPGPVHWRPELGPRKTPPLVTSLYVMLVLLVIAGAFWAGGAVQRLTAPKTPARQSASSPDIAVGPAWSETELGQLDRALAADQGGELGKALASASSLRSNFGALPGLDLYLASILTRQSQFIEAEKTLIAAAQEPNAQAFREAEINTARGYNLVRERRFDRASKVFGEAALANPFEPVYFRNWGEALRRYGRLQEAVTRFQEEILRYPAGQSEMAIGRQAADFRIRLCLIEGGQEASIKPALEEHLAGAAPGGYWYLTGAAYALSQGDMAGAAAALTKAKESMPADEFEAILGDYFFRTYSVRPEVASFFKEDPRLRQQRLQKGMIYFIDP